jgi:hypothetical protein
LYRRQDLLRHERIERDMHQGFHKTTSTIHGQLQTVSQRVEEVRDGISARQASLDEVTSRFRKHTADVQKHFVSINQNALRQHNKTRYQIAQGNTKVIETICSKLQDLPRNLAQTHKSAKRSSRQIRFNGQSREAMLAPLLLLKPRLRSAILNTISQMSDQVSAQQLYWLESEFENLISSATQEVAAVSQRSTATSFDEWVYQHDVTSSMSADDVHSRPFMPKERLRCAYEVSNQIMRSNGMVRKRPKNNFQCLSFNLPVGEVQIVVPRPSCVSPNDPDSSDVIEVGFSFLPQSDICPTAIHGRFVKVMNLMEEPRLYAQLNVFNFVKDWSAHLQLIPFGTLEDIDNAFRIGKISPYDMSNTFENICFFVRLLLSACNLSWTVFVSNVRSYSLQRDTVEWMCSSILIAKG